MAMKLGHHTIGMTQGRLLVARLSCELAYVENSKSRATPHPQRTCANNITTTEMDIIVSEACQSLTVTRACGFAFVAANAATSPAMSAPTTATSTISSGRACGRGTAGLLVVGLGRGAGRVAASNIAVAATRVSAGA